MPEVERPKFCRTQNKQSVHKGAWMPEVERPKFRKDAKQAERSLKGKGVGAEQGIVRKRRVRWA